MSMKPLTKKEKLSCVFVRSDTGEAMWNWHRIIELMGEHVVMGTTPEKYFIKAVLMPEDE